MKPFTIVTDHSALKWLQTSKIPKGRRARWIMELQQYDFQIKHRPGKANANADALSRIHDESTECYIVLAVPANPEDDELVSLDDSGDEGVCEKCDKIGWCGDEWKIFRGFNSYCSLLGDKCFTNDGHHTH